MQMPTPQQRARSAAASIAIPQAPPPQGPGTATPETANKVANLFQHAIDSIHADNPDLPAIIATTLQDCLQQVHAPDTLWAADAIRSIRLAAQNGVPTAPGSNRIDRCAAAGALCVVKTIIEIAADARKRIRENIDTSLDVVDQNIGLLLQEATSLRDDIQNQVKDNDLPALLEKKTQGDNEPIRLQPDETDLPQYHLTSSLAAPIQKHIVITDAAKVPDEFKAPDIPLILKAVKKGQDIPGIEVKREVRLAIPPASGKPARRRSRRSS